MLPWLMTSLVLSAASAPTALAQQPGTSPVKVYVMMGQSNMEGQGEMAVGMGGQPNVRGYTANMPGTLEYITDDANDPTGNYDFLKDGTGNWIVRNDVWMYYNNGRRILNDPAFPITGNLQPGWGPVSPDSIGPELGFGHKMGNLHGNQVLLIKTAWGGRSLYNDFLPPSSRIGLPEPQAAGDPGYDYERAVKLVADATSNLGSYFPNYNGQGYEFAGICWHQGWNDRGRTSLEYRTNLANLIRDLRKEFGVPNCPFVIATTGMASPAAIESAQRAMEDFTLYPEFQGNVSVIDTRNETYLGYNYEQPVADSPTDQNYHWNRNARTYLHIGLAMGDAMAALESPRCPSRLGATSGSASSNVTLAWQNGTETPNSVRILRDGVEIAAAAPVSPASYVDSALSPGTYAYELQFNMPVTPCDPLTLTVNTGITDLTATSGTGVELQWKNNLSYPGIKITRNGTIIQASLAGNATTYTDTGAPSGILLKYTVEPTNGTSAPAQVSIGTNLDTSGDFTPPAPSTMTWATPPAAVSSSAITMTAATASDDNGVEYYFTCTSGGGHDSGWQSSPTYTDTGLSSATTYGYTVQARDLSVNANANTASSPVATATTRMAGQITIASQFSFKGDLANNPAYSSNPGNDTGGGDLYGANKPITISPTGFTSVGTDKLVGVVCFHNSAASVSDLTSLTYGGVDLTYNIVLGNADGSAGTRAFLFYVDHPVADGNLVFNLTAGGNVDEVSLVLFALNGTAPGVLRMQKGRGPLYASSGDFVLGTSQRNNQSMSVTNAPPYTQIPLTAGNLSCAAGYLVATSSGPTGPTYSNSSDPYSTLAVFEAATVPAETIPPTLAPSIIVDDRSGAPMNSGFVTYTVTFSEDMDSSTVTAADFSNAGTSSIVIGSVSESSPGVFSVAVTPTGVGTLRLQVSAGAVLKDAAGNPLDTTSAIMDDTTITVNSVNSPPVFASNPITGSDATEDSAYSGTLAGTATDANSDPLTYARVSGPAWLNVAGNGALSGTPTNANVGANSFTVSVTDGKIASPVQATLNINVINTNDAPVFSSNPITGTGATANSPCSGTIAGSATDDDNNPLTYAKVSGPAWLNVAGDGTLSGTPTSGNVGANSFTISVTDGIVASPVEATLNIQVAAAPSGLVTIASQFSLTVDAAQLNSGYSSTNAGNDTGQLDNFWANAPITVTPSGFTAAGSSKLVLGLTLYNSAALVAPLTSLTYGGVDLLPNVAVGTSTTGNAYTRQFIFYLDNPAVDGNLVIGLDYTSRHVDEFAVVLFALNGTTAGAPYATESSGAQSPVQQNAAAGDFVFGLHTRNNVTSTVSNVPTYTSIPLRAGNMGTVGAYRIVSSAGLTAPVFVSGSGATTTLAFFAASQAPPSSAYQTWATTNAPTTGNDPSADEDGDGVSNAIESVLGGTISTKDLGKLPRVHQDGDNMTFTFQRAQQSIHLSTALSIETGTDVANWTDVYPVPDGTTVGPPVTVLKNTSPGYDTVTLSVPMTPGSRKFGRLKVVVGP